MIATRMLIVALGTAGALATAQQEGPSHWRRLGREAVQAAKARGPLPRRARNVILFVGDGMGISTVTAARIFAGQQLGSSGEENLLSFERLPYTALVKTYNTNAQVPDSAGTMTAMITGVKTRAGVLSVDSSVERGDFAATDRHKPPTLLEQAEQRGLSTGIVTTACVTHATPAACFAHSPERSWEDDSMLSQSARDAGFADMARQLIEFPFGDGVDVVLGGGRRHFLPGTMNDPEDAGVTGSRMDGRNLTAEWQRKTHGTYVWNQSQFDRLDGPHVEHLLGLFDADHMEFEVDRSRDEGGEPSLADMTAKAIELLSRNPKGYFLMVEAARIDHAHHGNNAFRALTDTVALDHAVSAALRMTDREQTLVIVTADHGCSLTISGYPTRGNPILGKVRMNDVRGRPGPLALDRFGHPYSTLSYATGPGFKSIWLTTGIAAGWFSADPEDRGYRQDATVPLIDAAHSGEDVAVYAGGPGAHLFHGVREQSYVYDVMAEAMGFAEPR